MSKPGRKGKRETLRLRLYVAGNSPNSLLAIANAKSICAKHFAAAHDLEIVDLLEYPGRAMADKVVATPTLLKLSPGSTQRLIGNLSDVSRVLLTLSGNT